MIRLAAFRINRACALLGIALTLIFASSSLSSAVDHIQHAAGASADHDHLVVSEISAVADNDLEHHGSLPDEDSPTDRIAGGHHHQGDSGSALPSLLSVPVAAILASGIGYGSKNARPALRQALAGPERPPKAIVINS